MNTRRKIIKGVRSIEYKYGGLNESGELVANELGTKFDIIDSKV